ncbi:sodium/bile acid symporter family protein [Burkholderia pseudomallei]|nr:sodium/bile acid symporter family protein [Burkholderia pseudomallei]
MLFHQIQLMTCAALAQRWGARDTSRERRADAPGAGALGSGASAAKR